MAGKRTVVFASGIGTGLIAFSAVFALVNGVFSNGKADAVGTFRPVTVHFVPSTHSAPRTTAKTSPPSLLTAPSTSSPTTVATAARPQSSSPHATSFAAPTSPATFAPAPTSSDEWPSPSATPEPTTPPTTHEPDDHKPDDGRLSDD